MSARPSGNQSGVQQSWPLTAFACPVAASIRATLQLAPNEFATPESHLPSGDQVNCWKKPLRGSVRTVRRLATSTIEMPLIVRHAICSPSGLQLAQGYSPGRPRTVGREPSLEADHQLALGAVVIPVDRFARPGDGDRAASFRRARTVGPPR